MLKLLVIASLAALGLIFWVATLLIGIAGARRIRSLGQMRVQTPHSWPKVSVIIPACNEVKTLAQGVQSHLKTAYPAIEIIVVDDRSTDGTSDLVDHLAEQDRRIRAVHIRELPDGWLGKVHAMQTGQRLASGEWMLFTDAGVVIAPETLAKAIALCETEGRDLLTVIPRLLPVSPAVDAATTSMARAIFGGGQVWKAEDPGASQVAGFGAFILVRRAVFDRSAGFEALRMEVADDLGIGLLMKEAGGRCVVLRALDDVQLHFYASLAQMRTGIEKGAFGIMGRYSMARLMLMSGAALAMELGPFAALVPVGVSWLPALGALGVLAALGSSVGAAAWLGRPVLSGILFPLGIVLNTCLFSKACG